MGNLWKWTENMEIVWKTHVFLWENSLRSMESFLSVYGIVACKHSWERMRGKTTFGLWKYFHRSMGINGGTQSERILDGIYPFGLWEIFLRSM